MDWLAGNFMRFYDYVGMYVCMEYWNWELELELEASVSLGTILK